MNGSIPLIVRDGRISLGASFAWKMATLATINSSTVSASFAFTSARFIWVYFVRNGDTIVVLLCGGDKGSQRRDIQRAITMAKASGWRSRLRSGMSLTTSRAQMISPPISKL
jgi:hypothetical protein